MARYNPAMKLLCLCSALDVGLGYGCTPAWWQFLKGLSELGHDVIAVPYAGAAFDTPWWRSYPNPCQIESKAFSAVKKWFNAGAASIHEGRGSKVSRALIESWIRPRWEQHLAYILARERTVEAVLVFSIPVNHFTGIPSRMRIRFSVPFFYYDGDVPASLPRFGGFASGFRSYEHADLGEYDGFMCNSEGGAEELRAMGARRVVAIHWGADPAMYDPIESEKRWDVFFYGYGVEYREQWFDAMIVQPSRDLPGTRFAIAGRDFPAGSGNVEFIGDVPFNRLRAVCPQGRINLNISRSAHAGVRGSSTLRLFELAAMGCCIVSNPHDGIEQWFEPGTELAVAESAGDARNIYRTLLTDASLRLSMGRAARQRVIECHTHRHRAAEIAAFVSSSKRP